MHLGHLVLAEQAKEALGLVKVIFVPSNIPPHKRTGRLARAEQRYQMLSLALKYNPHFIASDLELSRKGISYSIETIKQLKSTLRRSSLFFIVGSDFLKDYLKWKDLAEINKICKFAVAQRPGYPFKRLPANIQALNIAALNISSTDIRKRIQAKQSIRYLLPEQVRKYIIRKKLYR